MGENSFQDLKVWDKSMDLVVTIHDLCKTLPRDQRFVLIPQMQRASLSVPCNIAEDHGRRSAGDFARFLTISLGSTKEIQTLVLICRRLKYIEDVDEILAQCDEICRMLSGLIKTLKKP